MMKVRIKALNKCNLGDIRLNLKDHRGKLFIVQTIPIFIVGSRARGNNSRIGLIQRRRGRARRRMRAAIMMKKPMKIKMKPFMRMMRLKNWMVEVVREFILVMLNLNLTAHLALLADKDHTSTQTKNPMIQLSSRHRLIKL